MRRVPVAALVLGTAFAAGMAGAQQLRNAQESQETSVAQFGVEQGVEQSVADAARHNRELAQAQTTPPRLYTNADIEALGGTVGAAANAPAEAQAETERWDAAQRAAVLQAEEKFWRKRFADLRRDIADKEAEIDILQRELGVAQVQYYPEPIVALREQYSREEINGRIGVVTEKRLELSVLQKQLSDLEDALRRSGGPPGWSR